MHLQDARVRGGSVLIHCQQGVSQSVSLAMAWIMERDKLGYCEVLDLVRLRWRVARPSLGFAFQVSLPKSHLSSELRCWLSSVPYEAMGLAL